MAEIKTVLTNEQIDDIQSSAYAILRDKGYTGGMGGFTWDRASARAIEAAVLSANAGKVDAAPISSGYALENFAVWIAQELHPMSESRETVERLLHAYMHASAPTQQAIDAGRQG